MGVGCLSDEEEDEDEEDEEEEVKLGSAIAERGR